jgi:hypothetical protein
VAELKERLRADLNAAMRARDQVRMRTLRMALTSITNEEVAGASARDLSDEEIVKVLTREARKRREAAEAFGAAGRDQQAAAERAEGGSWPTTCPHSSATANSPLWSARRSPRPVPAAGRAWGRP